MIKNSDLKKKSISSTLISSCLVLYITLFSTGEIFFNNYGEFNYLYSEIVLYLIGTSILFIYFFTLVLLALPNRLFKIITPILLALILLSWIEGNLLYPDLGSLDGRVVDWDNWLIWGYIDLSIWIFAIIFFGYVNNYIFKHLNKASIIFIITMLFSFAVNYQNYSSKEHSNYTFDYNSISNFSSKENVIVILLDEVQSDVFFELINEYPIIKKVFRGFTYYPDTVTGYSYTMPVIPLMFTGQYYDNSEPFSEYVNRSYLDSSFTSHLIDNHYRVELYPKFVDLNYLKSKQIAHNIISKSMLSDFDRIEQQSSNLITLALFKISPHVFRKHIYNKYIFPLSNNKKEQKTAWGHMHYWHQDNDFVRKIEAKSNIIYKQPTFKYFHLRGAHVPWIYDANGNIIEENELTGSRKNYKDHLLHSLKLTSDILRKFHEIDIYDSSHIYILSDHGAGRSYATRVNPDTRHKNIGNNENSIIPYIIKARAIPLFMKKKPYSNKDLKISNDSISISEFPKMLMKDLELNADISKYRTKDNEIRKYFYFDSIGLSNISYLSPMFEFYIKGDSWLDSSWQGPNKVYSEKGNYEKLLSLVFNKISKCLNNRDDEIQNDLFKFFYNKENEYILNIKKKIENHILLVVSFNYSEDFEKINLDIFLNESKINTIKSSGALHKINIPYQGVYIDKNKLNLFDKNNIKLQITGTPDKCLKKTIHSLHLFELEK
jgi:hypothetical protein